MDAPPRLTWHAGSILPFASLWHTLLRTAALNRLKASELSAVVTTGSSGRPAWGQGSRVSALFNETMGSRREAFCVAALARWLGEPEAAFAWSHLGRLPRSVRCVVSTALRICPVCIAAGYHSAVFSIALLMRCPIHGCEFVDRCRCGCRIEGCIDPAALGLAGYCACGRTAFFTRETCRRPTMARAETDALQPVVAWLERLATVSRPRFDAVGSQNADDRVFWQQRHRWCGVLGLGFPSCFDRPSATEVPMAIAMATTPLVSTRLPWPPAATGSGPEHRPDDQEPVSVWRDDPATTVYRAMARHLRRHVARGSEPHAREFLCNPDPRRMARTMRSHRPAMVAFADLTFSRRMEADAVHRRWPYRAAPQPSAGQPPRATLSPTLEQGFEQTQGLDARSRIWLEYHIGEATVVQAWRQAQLDALEAVQHGIVDWRWVTAPSVAASASTTLGAELRFFSIANLGRIDWTLPRPDKAARCRAWQSAAQRRRTAMLATCSGPCLTWDERSGWRVQAASRPAQDAWKRHRLLGASGARPSFWLYEDGDLFVARACDIKLQGYGSSPKAAIDALRVALRQYRRQFPGTATDSSPAPVSAVPAHRGVRPDGNGQVLKIARTCAWHRGASADRVRPPRMEAS